MDRTRSLLTSLETLSTEEQQAFLARIKEVISDYSERYKELLYMETKPSDNCLSDLDNQTLQKLDIIESGIRIRHNIQIDVNNFTKEETELLSLIDTKEKAANQTPTRKQ